MLLSLLVCFVVVCVLEMCMCMCVSLFDLHSASKQAAAKLYVRVTLHNHNGKHVALVASKKKKALFTKKPFTACASCLITAEKTKQRQEALL